jgi:NADH dehydrogenase [ubiquinone] 1 alpha subcomplex assembly factor 6
MARSRGAENLSAVAAIVRRRDPDRFQTALFAPTGRREALFALYAFNYEIARVRESVTDPTLGQIRLEWWREAVAAAYAGAPARHHPVAEALAEAVRATAPAREHFEALIDARAADLDDTPPANLAALEYYAEGTSSRLVLIALEILGTRDRAAFETGRHAGIAYALAGLLRALPLTARTGRLIIPADIAARHGIDPGDWRGARGSPGFRAAVAEIADAARRHLAKARAGRRTIPHPALAALLPTVVAAHALDRLARARYDAFDPALARADPLQSLRLALAAFRHRF